MKPRVLIAHARYKQRGGEDQVVDAEMQLLRTHGHATEIFQVHNDDTDNMSKGQLLRETLWSTKMAGKLGDLVAEFKPDILHVHNTFPLLSPAIYWKARELGIPVVQTLHNFRWLCPQAMFLRNHAVCEDCKGHFPWRAVTRRCYRDSRLQSAVLAGMLSMHSVLGTFGRKVDAYIALTEFTRRLFIDAGFSAEKIFVKPNFVDIDEPPASTRSGGLFVGRLYPEKGIDTLAQAADGLPAGAIKVIGSGPEEGKLQEHSAFDTLGWCQPAQVHAAMQCAEYLVVPSIWYETFGLIVIEAFANGTPVIASRIGALQELVTDGETGLLVEPGNANELKKKLLWAEQHPYEMKEMGIRAREIYVQKYTGTENYQQLSSIYAQVVSSSDANAVRM